MTWPNDADGDVFRTLEEDGFDFSSDHLVDFNIDFENWPPAAEAITLLKEKYNRVDIIEPDEEFEGYVKIQVTAELSYAFVTRVQKEITKSLKKYAAKCESWEVMDD